MGGSKEKRGKVIIKVIVIGIFLIFLYFFTRLYLLKELPIFQDEFIYARWAQQGKYDAALRMVSLTDGKQPLFVWLAILTMHITSNPIIAVRIVSIASGFFTAIGLYLLSRELFKSKFVSMFTVFLFIIFPFALFINRLGIYESLVGMLLTWTLYAQILLVRYIRFDISLVLGMLFGLNLLTKTSSVQTIYLFPITILAGRFINEKDRKKIVLLIAFSLIAVGFGFLYSSVLFLSPLHYMISEKNYQFIYHVQELIPYGAFFLWGKNLITMFSWLSMYFSISLLAVAILSVFVVSFRREKILLLLWFLIPLVWLGLFGRILTPRYIYPMTLTLLPIIALGFSHLYYLVRNKKLFAGIFLFSISFALFTDYKILTDLKRAPLPKESLFEHINGWPSGEGIREIVSYLTNAAKNGSIFIVTEGTYGSLPTLAMELYFVNNPSVERMGLDKISEQMPEYLQEKAKIMPVYVIFNMQQNIPDWPMDLILQQRKGISDYYIRLYRIRHKD